jgi:hypothetical protein
MFNARHHGARKRSPPTARQVERHVRCRPRVPAEQMLQVAGGRCRPRARSARTRRTFSTAPASRWTRLIERRLVCAASAGSSPGGRRPAPALPRRGVAERAEAHDLRGAGLCVGAIDAPSGRTAARGDDGRAARRAAGPSPRRRCAVPLRRIQELGGRAHEITSLFPTARPYRGGPKGGASRRSVPRSALPVAPARGGDGYAMSLQKRAIDADQCGQCRKPAQFS